MTTVPTRPARNRRKRILVVNVFFDDYRRPTGAPGKVPQAMGHVYLAGAFSRERCEVRVFNEQRSGPLDEVELLRWPDMLILTGLTSGFDRMLHLTAYAKTLNPSVVVVAGGPAIRALPQLAQRFFDYACRGDIEELQVIAAEVLGRDAIADEFLPRFDLASLGPIGYVESSRYCNFRCSFCSLTGEGRRYQPYDLDYIRRQLLAVGRRRTVLFIDNNFYGNDRSFFLARLELLREMRARGAVRRWAALVTEDFFLNGDNLDAVREAGCHALFSGVESFDPGTLLAYRKRQNVPIPQVETIRRCLDSGILFLYGIMLDVTTRRLAELQQEVDFIIGQTAITLPSFFTLTIPLLGTPYFRDCVERRLLLPNTMLRNLDGTTLAMRPLDPLEDVAAFLGRLATMKGKQLRLLRHAAAFSRRYGRKLGPVSMGFALGNTALLARPAIVTGAWPPQKAPRRTYIGATERLDPQYTPMIRVPSSFRRHFAPTVITDGEGNLTAELAPDLEGTPAASLPEVS